VATVELKNLTLYYGKVLAVDDISLTIEDGKLYVLLGPTGCGKTSTMRMIAGLETPTAGEIYLDTQLINHLYPGDRNVAMVFQDYALYPHMTVRRQLAFPLKALDTPRDEITRRVAETADLLQLTDLLDRYPNELSVGQQQRVAIGRALIRRPKVFLMDEPLGQLDGRMRSEMRANVKRLQKELGITTVYVTHDQLEAQSLADTIVVMRRGVIQQIGTPEEIYNHPATLFVAGFIGTPSMNFLSGALRRENGGACLESAHLKQPLTAAQTANLNGVPDDTALVLGIRPEHIRLGADERPDATQAQVDVVEPHSNEYVIGLQFASGKAFKVRQERRTLGFRPEPGQTVWARLLPDKIHLFDEQTEESLL
jgi:ABC-type sugar transport system ATPase subunit